jgi:hypothetical protein
VNARESLNSFLPPLRAWLELDAEDRALTLVEDPSFAEYVRQALHALNVETQVADEARLVRHVGRHGMGYGWRRFDEVVAWADEEHRERANSLRLRREDKT